MNKVSYLSYDMASKIDSEFCFDALNMTIPHILKVPSCNFIIAILYQRQCNVNTG